MRLVLTGMGSLILAAGLSAQSPPASYLSHLPPMPKMVSQTEASVRFNLFGDRSAPEYRDQSPVDGIDDARGELLARLSYRFAPILRRNNFSGPRDFEQMLRGRLMLQMDTWENGKLVRSDSLLLNATSKSANDSLSPMPDQLLALVQQHGPKQGEVRYVSAERESETVLYFDFPGSDERSWRSEYGDETRVRAYVHPFIHDAGSGEDRYTLVLQYWFFYPFNDSANNHEGDWEHIAVALTTPQRGASPTRDGTRLNQFELERILSGAIAPDSLTIAFVEYYFHETYTVLDYAVARSGECSDNRHSKEWLHFHVWGESDYVCNAILARQSDPRLANHPIGYIGGNSRGPDELMEFWPRFQKAYNRNGHGTYPFPGTWQAVGPLGTTESLSGETVPELRGMEGPRFLFEDPNFIQFQTDQLTLVPDWERVQDLVEDPVARAAWAWLILPIRWGYPASGSPGAGMVKHTDLGQVAPEGPAFQSTWNRLASATGWRAYEPQVMRVLMVPVTPWARMKNGWGVLNVPLALFGIVPGWNAAVMQALPWVTGTLDIFGAPPARTYYPGEPPFRFSSTGSGIAHTTDGAAFARLLPQTFDASIGLPSDSRPQPAATGALGSLDGTRWWMNIFYGRRLSMENTYTSSHGSIRYDFVDPSGATVGRVNGALTLRELTGGFRFNAWSKNDDALQAYLRAGYGYAWYTVDRVSVRGQPQPDYSLKGGYSTTILPSRKWWPNTWYAGTGIELFTPKRYWVLDRVGLGLRAETNLLWHRLGARDPRSEHLGWPRRNDYAFALLLGW